MKKVIPILLVIIMTFAFNACKDNTPKENVQVSVMIPKGTPQVALISMITEQPEFKGYDVSYEFPNSNDLLASMFMSQDAPIIIAPANLGAIIYNRGVDYRIHGVLIWGSLYLISDTEIGDISELAGHQIVSTGMGLTTDVLLRYLLGINGITQPDIQYASSATERVPLFMSGQSQVSLMPEPSLSLLLSQRPDTHIVMDFKTEWEKATGFDSGYPQASVFISEEFYSQNKGFVESFLKECEKAAVFANDDPQKTGEYYSQIEAGPPAAVISASIPRSNIRYESGKTTKDNLIKYFEILYSDSPDNIGGKMPDDKFYSGQ